MPLDLPTTEDRPLWDLWLSMFWLPAVTAAADANIFESLHDSPASAPELSQRLRLDPRAIEIMLPLLTSLGLLVRHTGRFQLTDLGRCYLVRSSPYYWGGIFERMGASTPQYGALLAALRGEKASTTGKPGDRPAEAWASGQVDLKRARNIARFMHSHSVPAALGLARACDFSGVKRLLDVGGGSGCYAIALAERHPQLHVTVMELPAMCQAASEYIEAAGLSGRVDTCAVDMFRDEWPRGYDAIFFANIFHDWDFATCARLAANAFNALADGGRIHIHEILLNESGIGPLVADTFSLVMLLGCEGRQFTYLELSRLLADAGFTEMSVTATYGYYSLVSGTRRARAR